MKSVRPAALFFNVLVCVCVAAAAALAAGCQTSKGFGQDVEKLGEKIQEKSK
jgi:predicted small secreted protein